MRTLTIILFAVFIILLPAYASREKQVLYTHFFAGQFFSQEKELKIHNGTDFISHYFRELFGIQDVLCIYIKESGTVCAIDLKKKKVIHTYSFKGLPQNDVYSFDVKDKNTFYFSTDSELFLCDSTHVTHLYHAASAIEERFFTYAYSPSVELNISADSTFYQCMLAKLDQEEPSYLEKRALMPSVGRFKIDGDSIICTDSVAYMPGDFHKKFYYGEWASCIFRGDSLQYLYSGADSIYSYNARTKRSRKAVAIAGFADGYVPKPFPKDSLTNLTYLYRHVVASASVRLFLYDPYRQVYYLGLKNEQSAEADDGKHLNNVFDFPFRLYVLNDKMQSLKYIDFPQGRFTALYQAFVGVDGLYLMLNQKQNISYEVFNFEHPAL